MSQDFQNWVYHFFTFKIDGDIPDSSQSKINNTVQMFNISVNFKDKKNLDHTLESSLDVKFLVEALFVIYQLSEIKDYSTRLSIPMFIGTVYRSNIQSVPINMVIELFSSVMYCSIYSNSY